MRTMMSTLLLKLQLNTKIIDDVKGEIKSRQLTRWEKKNKKGAKRKNRQTMINNTPSLNTV